MGENRFRRRKFLSESAYTIEEESPSNSGSGEDYRERVGRKILLEKGRRTDLLRRAKRGRSSATIDFNVLDQRGDPAISFDPGSKLRGYLLEVFDRPERDPVRKRTMLKVGTEFGRIYTRYRRDAQRELGHLGTYDMPKEERGYAAEAGMWCIVKGVTPRQVLEYWHANIKTFADRNLKVPPLTLLKSPGIIDRVACATLGESGGQQRRKPRASAVADPRPVGRNSFSDMGGLDRRLRPALERAGYDLSEYNDRFLLTIQKMAISVADGRAPFVSSTVKPMVNYAARHLYAESV